MTIAAQVPFASPLPPEQSGIADYSARLLPALAERHTLQIFTRHPERSSKLVTAALPIRGYPELEAGGRGATPIYQIGNHFGYHGEIYAMANSRPGVAVLHEYVLHDLVRDSALADGGVRSYVRELRYALGRTGDALARRVAVEGEGLSSYSWPLFERVVDRSLCTVVHSQSARRRIHASRPLASVVVVPHHVDETLPENDELLDFRDRHHIPRDALVVAAFGVVAPTKRLGLGVEAFQDLQQGGCRCFLIVGEGGRSWLRANPPREQDSSSYLALGRLDIDDLRRAMATCDIALNLRDPTGGESSGTCLRLLALARAVVVSDQGWFSEIPDDCCAKIAVDGLERAVLSAVLRGLVDNHDLRREIGTNARSWTSSQHSMQRTVAGYCEALEVAAAAEPPSQEPAPPLAAFPRSDVLSELVREVTSAAGDLGITEEDESFLGELAQTVVGLGLHFDSTGD